MAYASQCAIILGIREYGEGKGTALTPNSKMNDWNADISRNYQCSLPGFISLVIFCQWLSTCHVGQILQF